MARRPPPLEFNLIAPLSMNHSSYGYGRQAAKKPVRSLNFFCNAPQAQTVSLVGDFNNWNPAAHPMKHMPDNTWMLTVELKHGHHRYAFLVDGQITLDPTAQGVTRNDQGQRVSLVPVS